MLLPLTLFMGVASLTAGYFVKKAMIERSRQWLDIRLSEAIIVAKKHENILHKYGLQNIPASNAKAKLDALAELSSTTVGKDGYIFIADRQGVIVSHPDKYYEGTDEGQKSWFKHLSEGKKQTRIAIKNINYLAAHDFFAPWDWHIFIAEPEESTLYAIKKLTTALWMITTGGFLAIFCFIYFFTKRLTRPLDLITDSILKIEAGNIDTPIPTHPKDEFTDLAHAFNRMATYFQNRLNQSHKDQAYYNTLCQQATDLVTITDPHGQFIYVSPSAKRIIGYAPEELLGKKVSAFIHPSQKDEMIDHFRLATLSNDASPPVELIFTHKDGHLCTMESISKNLLSHPDVKGFVTTARNINKRKSIQDALEKSNKELKKQMTQKDEEANLLRQRLADETTSQKKHRSDLE